MLLFLINCIFAQKHPRIYIFNYYKLMKSILRPISLFVLLLLFAESVVNAQAVSINTTGTTPDASSILDMSAVNNKGILVPNVAITGTSDNSTIASAKTGLLIYNTATSGDVTPGYYYWNGTVWTRFTTTTYNFENGITQSGVAVKLGGDLTENTTINFGSGFGNDMTFDLKDNSNFIIKSGNPSATTMTFANNGNVTFTGNTTNGNVSSEEYYNFDGTFGETGFGFRERAGDLEYKKSGGSWSAFPDAPASGTAYWWYNLHL